MKKLFSVRTLILAGSLLLQLGTLCFQSRGAAGDVDLSFDPGSGVNGAVNAVAVQPDGKVIIGGWFTTVKGLERFKVARLNADGSGDSSFDPGASLADLSNNIDSYVSSVVLQPDGKVLIGGNFFVGGGYGIARLNTNGTLDSSFNSSAVNATLTSIALQPDGKVLIGGSVSVGGTNFTGIIRLNANGNLDGSFNSVTVGYGSVSCVALQPDGKVLVGGYLLNANGIQYGIARLNANGNVDSSFNPGTGANSVVHSIAVQTDLKVLIGGEFSSVNGTNRSRMARLNANGSLDGSFNPSSGATNSPPVVFSIAVQSDGKAVIGGAFSPLANRTCISRLNADGSPDSSFNAGTGANGDVHSVVLQPNGRVLIGGYFTSVNGTNRNRIARLNADGSLDDSFDLGKGIESYFSSLVVQPDGKVLVGGVLTFIYGTNRYGSFRLNADGSSDGIFISDTNFNPGFGIAHYLYSDPQIEVYYTITATAATVQPDGRLVVGVQSNYYKYYPEFGSSDVSTTYLITRLNADGSRDTSFNFTNTISLGRVSSLALQSDGKVIIGSEFYSFKIARLNADGSLDNSFNPGAGPDYGVTSVALQSDGKVLIGGYFNIVNGTNRFGIARLNANGSLDSSFNSGTGVSGVSSVALQPDGKVLIGGSFTTVNGTNRNGIARLNANGGLDLSFNPGTGPDGSVSSIALQPDGNVLIGGDFTMVNGVVRPHVARLYGDSVAPSLNVARSNAFVIVTWPVNGLNFQLQGCTNLSLPDSWSPVAEPAVTNAGQISVTVPTSVGQKFFRLKSQ